MQIQLHISRAPLSRQCVIYNWVCCREAEAIASGTAIAIETCLDAAATALAGHDNDLGEIEVLYRKVALGRFSKSELDTCAAEVADLIVERYEQTRMHA